MKYLNKYTLLVLLLSSVVFSCKEEEPITFTQEALFLRASGGSLLEAGPNTVGIYVYISSARDTDFTFDLVVTGSALEGVDYTFPLGKTITIPAGSYGDTLTIAGIDNDEIDDPRSISIAIPTDLGVTLADENSVSLTIADDDYYCPNDTFASVVSTETDEGYGSGPAFIQAYGGPGNQCLTVKIIGALTSIGSAPGNRTYTITLIEDAPMSSTGTIEPGTANMTRFASGDVASGSFTIVGGTYNLETGVIRVNYSGLFGYSGTLIYD